MPGTAGFVQIKFYSGIGTQRNGGRFRKPGIKMTFPVPHATSGCAVPGQTRSKSLPFRKLRGKDGHPMTSPVLLGNSIVYLTETPLSYGAEVRPDHLPTNL